ncbi:uncharacterized protein LOC116109335 [Pistacia vera]|uniref:uncharacterized protein LOC116109335 n=1 Tax=Pistacia vera TaxID=55513 RepID=UPI001262C059|nr:uncharacterized protein LOC116109335 [Pistacia vera]
MRSSAKKSVYISTCKEEAIGRDDADELKSLLTDTENHWRMMEDQVAAETFLIAYKQGSFHVAEGLAKLRPQIASIKSDEDGYTAMHHVCCGGDGKMMIIGDS